MARYAGSQRPKKKQNKDQLKASVHYNREKGSVYKKTQLNDGDASTYKDGKRVGSGPARPNWFRQRTDSSMSEKQMHKEVNKVRSKAKPKPKPKPKPKTKARPTTSYLDGLDIYKKRK